jgi:uncharacterized protein (TIGR02246 family)
MRFSALMALSAIVFCACTARPASQLSREDVTAIRQLENAYTSAWVRNDTGAVLATLARDAVLLPGRLPPIEGLAAIRAFWFPAGPPTTVLSYQTDLQEVDGSGDVAYARGRGDLTFEFFDSAGHRRQLRNRSVFLMIARRQTDGSWRIARRMWSDLAQ